MTKAMLSRRGVEFDAFDVENDPRAMQQLRALGLSSVPAVVDADVLGVFPAGLWLEAHDVPTLTGAALIGRYGEAVRAKFHA